MEKKKEIVVSIEVDDLGRGSYKTACPHCGNVHRDVEPEFEYAGNQLVSRLRCMKCDAEYVLRCKQFVVERLDSWINR